MRGGVHVVVEAELRAGGAQARAVLRRGVDGHGEDLAWGGRRGVRRWRRRAWRGGEGVLALIIFWAVEMLERWLEGGNE